MLNTNTLLEPTKGLAFCFVVGSSIFLLNKIFANIPFDTLLFALIAGILFRNIFNKSKWHIKGAKYANKQILEFSVMILGGTIFLPNIITNGIGLFLLILSGIAGSMLIAYCVGHLLLGLNKKLATLIGVGNSICGNSAIAVIAPIIGASATDIAAVIGISAILGAIQILLLPILAITLGLSDYHYGIVAGMAVYAVAQVYAASATISTTSASVATLVKLSRVMLLGPLVIIIKLIGSIGTIKTYKYASTSINLNTLKSIPILNYIPWFVIGFIILSTLRSTDLISEEIGNQILQVSKYLFVVSMVGIGLGVNIRDVLKVGPKVALTIFSILIFLIIISLLAGQILTV